MYSQSFSLSPSLPGLWLKGPGVNHGVWQGSQVLSLLGRLLLCCRGEGGGIREKKKALHAFQIIMMVLKHHNTKDAKLSLLSICMYVSTRACLCTHSHINTRTHPLSRISAC